MVPEKENSFIKRTVVMGELLVLQVDDGRTFDVPNGGIPLPDGRWQITHPGVLYGLFGESGQPIMERIDPGDSIEVGPIES